MKRKKANQKTRSTERGATMADAAVATPVFLLIVFGAIELLIFSWKALSVQLLANDAARLYATWYLCEIRVVGPCTHNIKASLVREAIFTRYYGSPTGAVTTSYPSGLDSRYGFAMTDANSTITTLIRASYDQTNSCGQAGTQVGEVDGEGDLVSVQIEYREVPLVLALLNFQIHGKAVAVVERFRAT